MFARVFFDFSRVRPYLLHEWWVRRAHVFIVLKAYVVKQKCRNRVVPVSVFVLHGVKGRKQAQQWEKQ